MHGTINRIQLSRVNLGWLNSQNHKLEFSKRPFI